MLPKSDTSGDSGETADESTSPDDDAEEPAIRLRGSLARKVTPPVVSPLMTPPGDVPPKDDGAGDGDSGDADDPDQDPDEASSDIDLEDQDPAQEARQRRRRIVLAVLLGIIVVMSLILLALLVSGRDNGSDRGEGLRVEHAIGAHLQHDAFMTRPQHRT